MAFAFGGGEEDASVLAGTDGDVAGEAATSSGFFQDHGSAVRIAELDPSEADSGWDAGVAQTLGGFELTRLEIDGLGTSGLRGRAGNMQQVLEELDHVRWC